MSDGRIARRATAVQWRDHLGNREIVRVQEPDPVMDVTREFIVTKHWVERYSALAGQPGRGYVRIARTLGKEALKKD